MYARFSTFHAQLSAIDAGIAYVRDDVMMTMQHLEGFVGLSMLVDRTSGLCIATSAWKTHENMRASAQKAGGLRERASVILGSPASVEEFEIALLHRAHRAQAGSRVRGTFCELEPSKMDTMLDTFKMATLPTIEDFTGFSSAGLFVNRETGRACLSVTYDSEEALASTRMNANDLRERTLREYGATLDEVCEFELSYAHFHVPELVG